MNLKNNDLDAQVVKEEARQFLEGLDKFYGNHPLDQQERIWEEARSFRITYEKPHVVEMEFLPCGANNPGEGHLMRLDGEEILILTKNGSWVKMKESADFEDEDEEAAYAAYVFMWKVFDPRRILANIDYIELERGVGGERILKGILNAYAFNPPQDFVEYILTGADDPLKPGCLNPQVAFEIDSQNRPMRMTIGRILPDDSDEYQIEFSYSGN